MKVSYKKRARPLRVKQKTHRNYFKLNCHSKVINLGYGKTYVMERQLCFPGATQDLIFSIKAHSLLACEDVARSFTSKANRKMVGYVSAHCSQFSNELGNLSLAEGKKKSLLAFLYLTASYVYLWQRILKKKSCGTAKDTTGPKEQEE